jgi:hypothetical protein
MIKKKKIIKKKTLGVRTEGADIDVLKVLSDTLRQSLSSLFLERVGPRAVPHKHTSQLAST